MQINLSGHHVEINENLRSYVTEKISKLERFFDRITQIYVVLKVEKMQHIAEATLHADGEELHATSQNRTLYAAIDLLTDKLARQLTKRKDKRHQH